MNNVAGGEFLLSQIGAPLLILVFASVLWEVFKDLSE